MRIGSEVLEAVADHPIEIGDSTVTTRVSIGASLYQTDKAGFTFKLWMQACEVAVQQALGMDGSKCIFKQYGFHFLCSFTRVCVCQQRRE